MRRFTTVFLTPPTAPPRELWRVTGAAFDRFTRRDVIEDATGLGDLLAPDDAKSLGDLFEPDDATSLGDLFEPDDATDLGDLYAPLNVIVLRGDFFALAFRVEVPDSSPLSRFRLVGEDCQLLGLGDFFGEVSRGVMLVDCVSFGAGEISLGNRFSLLTTWTKSLMTPLTKTCCKSP